MSLCIFLLLMLISLGMLIYFTYNPKGNIRFLIKFITSSFFIFICIFSYRESNNNFIYFILILTGLIFSLLGDILLGFRSLSKNKRKVVILIGGISFLLTHIFYSIAFANLIPISRKDFLITIIISLTSVISLNYIKGFNFRGMFIPVCIYTITISFMVSKAASLFTLISAKPLGTILVITGAVLFIISDMILSLIFFYKNAPRYLSALNLITYYIGQGLIALSVLYI